MEEILFWIVQLGDDYVVHLLILYRSTAKGRSTSVLSLREPEQVRRNCDNILEISRTRTVEGILFLDCTVFLFLIPASDTKRERQQK